jgi:flagellar hook assembly protein FlgD
MAALGFDMNGDLWISALSMGVAHMLLRDPADAGAPAAVPALSVELATPNPFRSDVSIRLGDFRPVGSGQMHVYDSAGRLVRRLAVSNAGDEAVWDGRDDAGRPVVAGVYYARADRASMGQAIRLVKLR